MRPFPPKSEASKCTFRNLKNWGPSFLRKNQSCLCIFEAPRDALSKFQGKQKILKSVSFQMRPLAPKSEASKCGYLAQGKTYVAKCFKDFPGPPGHFWKSEGPQAHLRDIAHRVRPLSPKSGAPKGVCRAGLDFLCSKFWRFRIFGAPPGPFSKFRGAGDPLRVGSFPMSPLWPESVYFSGRDFAPLSFIIQIHVYCVFICKRRNKKIFKKKV